MRPKLCSSSTTLRSGWRRRWMTAITAATFRRATSCSWKVRRIFGSSGMETKLKYCKSPRSQVLWHNGYFTHHCLGFESHQSINVFLISHLPASKFIQILHFISLGSEVNWVKEAAFFCSSSWRCKTKKIVTVCRWSFTSATKLWRHTTRTAAPSFPLRKNANLPVPWGLKQASANG